MAVIAHESRVLTHKGLGGLFNPTGELAPKCLGGLINQSVPGYWQIKACVAYIPHQSRILTHKGLGDLFNLSVPGTGI